MVRYGILIFPRGVFEMDGMKKVSQVGLYGVLGNIFLMLIKLISGIIFSSQAMIADGINSTMDIFASLMTLLGGKIAEKPRDRDHHFGHGKAEFLFSLFVSLSMFFGAIFIFKEAISGLFSGHRLEFSFLLILVCLTTIIVKGVLYFYSRKVYNETKSILVESSMLDHRNDMIVTTFTLISIILSRFQVSFFDSLTSMGIAILIFYSGIKIFLDSYAILMDHALDENRIKEIKKYILRNKKIHGITKFETTPVGYQYLLILSILVDGNLSTYESHEIADNLEKKLIHKYPELLTVTIHVNPVKT